MLDVQSCWIWAKQTNRASLHQPPDLWNLPRPRRHPRPPCGFYLNPFGVDLKLTATEMSAGAPQRTVTSWDHFSATVQLKATNGGILSLPFVRGMAYATAVYSNLTPQLHSDSTIVSINGQGMSTGSSVTEGRFIVQLNDGAQASYIVYVLNGNLTLKLQDTHNLEVLDDRARAIPTGGTLESVSVSGSSGKYQIVWNVTNDDGKGVLMYAYPHHQSSISSAQPTNLTLASATHGYIDNMWTLTKPDLSTASWLPRNAAVPKALLQPVTDALDADLRQDWTYDCDRATNYFSGKALQKWALVALISNRPETGLAARQNAVQKLKDALAPFLGNVQQDPFNYDATYKGVVARCRITSGDAGCEFGHTHYNDHHFHQGYLIATAAVIKMLDPAWRSDELNAWTEALIRDALPSAAPLTDATKNRTRNPSTSSGPQALGALNQQHGSPLSELTAAKRAGPHRERLLLPPRRQRKPPSQLHTEPRDGHPLRGQGRLHNVLWAHAVGGARYPDDAHDPGAGGGARRDLCAGGVGADPRCRSGERLGKRAVDEPGDCGCQCCVHEVAGRRIGWRHREGVGLAQSGIAANATQGL
ncbi:glycosyl hydrolase family 81-domain-containing protein [Jimgerdemannia flammicorona]|uniref:glucan endo-1,3-beta-D-glucosidase n=1 Tax=Jimgerdemannia flammicorona TaxID=994334 RepID=A0A433QIH1_9FUNG|nr:glycosyl hydrolase family 81-domain-containing protein [Jimgerdemannia flammicorona]